jgi:hypothetical protein
MTNLAAATPRQVKTKSHANPTGELGLMEREGQHILERWFEISVRKGRKRNIFCSMAVLASMQQ